MAATDYGYFYGVRDTIEAMRGKENRLKDMLGDVGFICQQYDDGELTAEEAMEYIEVVMNKEEEER